MAVIISIVFLLVCVCILFVSFIIFARRLADLADRLERLVIFLKKGER